MKIVALVSAPEGADRGAFRRWYLQEFAPDVLRRHGDKIDGLAVNVLDRNEAVYPDAKKADTADVYAEFWVPAGQRLTPADISILSGTQEVYRVNEMVELDHRPRDLGRTPGVKVMAGLYPITDATPADSRRFWDAHVPLALRVHVGMNGYVREWIEEPLSDVRSPIFGIASMHFPSIEEMRDRFFDSPESIPVHAADLARFVGSAAPMITSRYLLKRPA